MATLTPEATLQALITGNGDKGQAVPGAAAAIIRDGRVVWAGSAGRRFLDGEGGPPLLTGTKMRVASISKVGIALLALKLVEQGKLRLDGDIAPILGFPFRNPAFPNDPITLRHLLSHTGTLRDGEVYWGTLGETMRDFFTPEGAHWEGGIHFAKGHPPGKYFTYCNLAFGVISTLMEKATGQRFDQFAQKALFKPLGLTCGYNWSGVPADDVEAGATLYRQDAAGVWLPQVDDPAFRRRPLPFSVKPGALMSDYKPGDNGLLYAPQGGLRASVLDLARLGLFLIGKAAPLLKPSTFKAMTTQVWSMDTGDGDASEGDDDGGALRAWTTGLHILTGSPNGDGPIIGQKGPLLGHFGEAYGLKAGLWVDIEARAGFVYALTGGAMDTVRAKGVRSGVTRGEEDIMNALYPLAFP